MSFFLRLRFLSERTNLLALCSEMTGDRLQVRVTLVLVVIILA